MRKFFSILVVGAFSTTALLQTTSVFADEGEATGEFIGAANPLAEPVKPNTNMVAPVAPKSSTSALDAPTVPPVPMDATSSDEDNTEFFAASNEGLAQSTSANLGEFAPVPCTSHPAFSANQCNQCFDGGKVKVGQRLTGMFDNWNNTSSTPLRAYQNEQKFPRMISLGGANWKASPADETLMWVYAPDIQWVPEASGKKVFMLPSSSKVQFFQADIGAGYTLDTVKVPAGDPVGMMKFPIVYHAVDIAAGVTDGPAVEHNECVLYKLNTTPAPVAQPVGPEVTQTETGPAETLLLIIAAFFIAFSLMFSLRKRQ